jgi:solute carrier family 45, member 1/2/4
MVYLIFAIVGVSTNLILPSILKTTYWNRDLKPSSRRKWGSDADNHRPGYKFASAWAICETLFALCMLATFFVKSWVGISVLIAYSGVSWAMAQWAPFAIIGEALSTLPGTENSTEDFKGTILGLHNVAISAPQVPAALVSSGILWIAQEFGNQDGGVWVLRGGACVTLYAAYLASRLDE